jgi:hypothetical protein
MQNRMQVRFDYCMNAAPRLQFTLAIDPASEPIAGAIKDGQGRSVEFSGWLGFAAALEELLGTLRQTPKAAEQPPVWPKRRQPTGVSSPSAGPFSAGPSSSRE